MPLLDTFEGNESDLYKTNLEESIKKYQKRTIKVHLQRLKHKEHKKSLLNVKKSKKSKKKAIKPKTIKKLTKKQIERNKFVWQMSTHHTRLFHLLENGKKPKFTVRSQIGILYLLLFIIKKS